MHKATMFLLCAAIMCGCAGKQSDTMIGGNLFAQWRPTDEQLAVDPTLESLRWTHAESMQLGSYVSMILVQSGENPPELVCDPVTQAGPINAALGAGGLIGAAVLFNPDPDENTTNVNQEGSSASADSDSKSGALAGAHSGSSSSASTTQSQGQIQGQLQGQKQGQIQGQKQGQIQGQKQKLVGKKKKHGDRP